MWLRPSETLFIKATHWDWDVVQSIERLLSVPRVWSSAPRKARHTPVIPAFRKWRREDQTFKITLSQVSELQTSLGYTRQCPRNKQMRPCNQFWFSGYLSANLSSHLISNSQENIRQRYKLLTKSSLLSQPKVDSKRLCIQNQGGN